jgi:hypothetical protein
MAIIHVVQEMFSIVDELAVILESMLGTFEGNAEDGPLANGMRTPNVNDEDSGADLARSQGASQSFYPQNLQLQCC